MCRRGSVYGEELSHRGVCLVNRFSSIETDFVPSLKIGLCGGHPVDGDCLRFCSGREDVEWGMRPRALKGRREGAGRGAKAPLFHFDH